MQIAQDIHSTDVSLWKIFENYWSSGSYTSALNLIENNSQLVSKYINADWLNDLTDSIVDIEEDQDTTFKQDRIRLASTPPTLSSGEVYFQLS